MRLAWTAGALLALLRRWAGFLLVVMAMLGIGYFVAAIGWPALPALWASSLPPAQGLAVLLAHAGIALLLAWGLRETLLPRHWLQAERALPLSWRQRSAADLLVVALAQSPLFLLYLASLLSWRHANPVWLRGHWDRGLLFMAASVLLSLLGATALLAWRRRVPRPSAAARSSYRSASGDTAGRLGAWRALVGLPLWRGPARPVAGALLLGTAGLIALLLLAWQWPLALKWFLAGYALVAMIGTLRVHSLVQRCHGPLLLAARSLPLVASFERRVPRLLALASGALCWPLLLATVLLLPAHAGLPALSPLTTPAYLLAALLAPALQLWGPSAQGEARAARWLLSLVLWVALATEIY